MELESKTISQIHSYKHNKQIHRVWNNIMILEKNGPELVVANYQTRVIESNGRTWNTKEPAICFFYEDEWFNVIAMLKQDGIYYYCNISSPYVYDGEAIKYIDYDLDVRVNPKFEYRILDRDEFKRHSTQMEYGVELNAVIEYSLKRILTLIESRSGPFDHRIIERYFEQYVSYNGRLKKQKH